MRESGNQGTVSELRALYAVIACQTQQPVDLHELNQQLGVRRRMCQR